MVHGPLRFILAKEVGSLIVAEVIQLCKGLLAGFGYGSRIRDQTERNGQRDERLPLALEMDSTRGSYLARTASNSLRVIWSGETGSDAMTPNRKEVVKRAERKLRGRPRRVFEQFEAVEDQAESGIDSRSLVCDKNEGDMRFQKAEVEYRNFIITVGLLLPQIITTACSQQVRP